LTSSLDLFMSSESDHSSSSPARDKVVQKKHA